MHHSSQKERLHVLGFAAAGIAHDINNQLNLIVNHLALPNVDAARQAVARCADLTASLLDYCSRQPLSMGALDPAAFLQTFLAETPLPEGVCLATSLPGTLPRIAANPAALSRVLANLISNACAAMNNRGVLTISASPLAIEIEDSGPGVPPEKARAVFEPFFTTKGPHGAGLGLAIVRDIMRSHGGSVTLHSRPGRGAKFTLRFRAPGPYGATFKASPRKIAPAA